VTDILIGIGAACALLLVVCLIVREQTENRIRQLRARAMGLRNDQKRLADRRSQLEQMESQLREVMLRTERQEATIDQEYATAAAKLEELYQRVRGESVSTAKAKTKDKTAD